MQIPNNYFESEYNLLALYGTVSSGAISSGSGYSISYSYYMDPNSASCNSRTFNTYYGTFAIPSNWKLLYGSTLNQPTSTGYQNVQVFKPINVLFNPSNTCFYWVSHMASGSSGVDLESQVYAELGAINSTTFNQHTINSANVQLLKPATQMQFLRPGGNITAGPFKVVFNNLPYPGSDGLSNAALLIYENGALTNITSVGPANNQDAIIINASGSELGIYVPYTFPAINTSQKLADVQLFTPVTRLERIYGSVSPSTPISAPAPAATNYTVTIQTSPSGASNYWGACLSTQYNGAYGQNGTICTSVPAGTSSATFDVPSGAAIQYLCTAEWHGAGGYNFSSWNYNGQQLPGESCYHPDIAITGPATFTANYNGNPIILNTTANTLVSQVKKTANTNTSEYTIYLHPGWNLFSTPITNVTSVTDFPYGCASNNVTSSIWGVVSGNYLANNSTPRAGVGYWVDMNSGCRITLNGTAFNSKEYSSLVPGWNTIGVPINTTFIGSVIGTCRIVQGPYGYNGTGYYNATYLTPGNGYLVNVANNCKLGASTAISSPLPPS